jgi:hypothetical protein
MGEPTNMSIEIGGTLDASKFDDLIAALKSDVYEFWQEPELPHKEGTITWEGISNYGECDEVRAFCENHDLSYVHDSEAGSEWDASTYYWAPGMKEVLYIKGDRDNDPIVNVSIIKPYTDLLLATSRKGQAALPLFINSSNGDLKELVKKGLTMKFDKFLVQLQKKLDKLLPGIPDLPPFILKE